MSDQRYYQQEFQNYTAIPPPLLYGNLPFGFAPLPPLYYQGVLPPFLPLQFSAPMPVIVCVEPNLAVAQLSKVEEIINNLGKQKKLSAKIKHIIDIMKYAIANGMPINIQNPHDFFYITNGIVKIIFQPHDKKALEPYKSYINNILEYSKLHEEKVTSFRLNLSYENLGSHDVAIPNKVITPQENYQPEIKSTLKSRSNSGAEYSLSSNSVKASPLLTSQQEPVMEERIISAIKNSSPSSKLSEQDPVFEGRLNRENQFGVIKRPEDSWGSFTLESINMRSRL